MTTEVKFEWTWTGYVGGAFLGEPDISVTADVHRDGEVFVTGVTIIEGRTNPPEIKVCLDESHDAFALALFAKIKADLEIQQSFIEKAIEESGDDSGDFYMSGGRKRCPDQWRENQLDAQESSALNRL